MDPVTKTADVDGQEPVDEANVTPTPAEGDGAAEGVEPAEGNESKDEEGKDDESKPELSPDDLKKEVARARAEAASYRTRLRDAEAKLGAAKTAEDFEAAVSELKATNAALERGLIVERVARKFDLPPELADRVQGSTPEEIEADAKKLSALLAPSSSGDPSGGLDPFNGSDSEFDPVAEARRARARRR